MKKNVEKQTGKSVALGVVRSEMQRHLCCILYYLPSRRDLARYRNIAQYAGWTLSSFRRCLDCSKEAEHGNMTRRASELW